MFNRKVERHSFGIRELSEHSKVSTAVAAKQYMEKQALLEHLNQIEKSTDRSEKEYEAKQAMSRIASRKLLESQIPAVVNKLHKEGREIVLKEILFEMFAKSLYLDADFVVQNENNLRHLVNQYVDKNGGYALIENAYNRTKSLLLKNIMTVCENVASKVARRKLTEIRENNTDLNDIRFELNEEETEELNYEKEKVSIDELADLVKKKVLTVIQDEKARQQKEEEIYRDLEQQAADQGTTVEEVMRKAVIKSIPIEESTLFNSLFRHSYKEILTESVASITGNGYLMEDNEDNDEVNTDIHDIKEDEYQEPTVDDVTTDDFEAEEEIDVNPDEMDINMDLILAESIAKYTLMEMAYTIKLEDYTTESIRKLSQKLLN